MIYGVYCGRYDEDDGHDVFELEVAFKDEALAEAHAREVDGTVHEVEVRGSLPEKATYYVATYDSIRAARQAAIDRLRASGGDTREDVLNPWGLTYEVWDYEPAHLEALNHILEPSVVTRYHQFEGGTFYIESRAGTKREASEALSAAVSEAEGKPWSWTAAGGRWT